jgi:hypothetical protein
MGAGSGSMGASSLLVLGESASSLALLSSLPRKRSPRVSVSHALP